MLKIYVSPYASGKERRPDDPDLALNPRQRAWKVRVTSSKPTCPGVRSRAEDENKTQALKDARKRLQCLGSMYEFRDVDRR